MALVLEKNEKDLVREQFELVSANLKMIVSKKPEHINYYERELLLNLLKKVNFIKESFDTKSTKFAKLAQSLELETHAQNQVVFRKGDQGEYFYIVIEGVYCVETQNIKECRKTKNIFYYPGDSFGEVSLIYDVPRGATIIANKNSSLVKIPKAKFNQCGDLEKSIKYLNNFFENHTFFEKEDKFMIRVVASLSKLVSFTEREVLIEEGHHFNEILFFVKGEANVYKRLQLELNGVYFQETILIAKLCEGDVFGEKFYLSKQPSNVRIISAYRGEFIRVSFKDNISTIETPLYRRIRQNANRFPTDDEYLEQFKIFLSQRLKQLDFLIHLRKDMSTREEYIDVKKRYARVKEAHLVK